MISAPVQAILADVCITRDCRWTDARLITWAVVVSLVLAASVAAVLLIQRRARRRRLERIRGGTAR